MFSVIHLPQFALQAALRHEPELWARPVALVDPALSTPRVCDATPPARALGVTDGLTPTQALARCRDVLIRHRVPTQEAAATDALLQCAYGFSPNIENTLPGTVTLDLQGLAELNVGQASSLSLFSASEVDSSPNMDRDRQDACPTMAWAQRLHVALASIHLRARIGIGATPNIARHAAYWAAPRSRRGESSAELHSAVSRICNPQTPAIVAKAAPSQYSRPAECNSAIRQIENLRYPQVGGYEAISLVRDPSRFVAGLPIGALEPSTDVAVILHKWGIRTVGELMTLGQEAVVDRLGLEALALFAAASIRTSRPLKLVRPVERFEEAFEFEHEIETVEPLLFILRRFVDYLSQRLEMGGLVAALLTLRLRLESGEALERRLRLPQPTRQADVLFRMLQTHLETLRTDAAIVGVALQAEPTQPEQKQFSLFEAALRDPQQFQETLARLSALVGAERVGTPVRENSHQPDAFKLVPPDFENAPSAVLGRVPEILRTSPLRRFRPAMPASVSEQPAPTADESASPISLRCAVANGKLVVALGPWRASGRWWEGGAWRREEWDVQTVHGVALRLVKRPEGWFVEGMAD